MIQPSQPLIAAGVFGSIGMLAWAAAAIIPLVLHLWNRRQHKTAPWAAMEFLLAAVQEQSKRMRIEQLLLLLLRMAIPIVLALALADPIWEFLGNSFQGVVGSQAPQHHLFVIDTSYSMGYREGDQSRLDQAKRIARDVVSSSSQGDGFTLINLSGPSESVIGLPAFAPNDALAEIANLKTRDNVADLASAMRLVNETVAAVRNGYPRLQQHRVYFLSDMGKTTWQAANAGFVRDQIGELETVAEIVTVDVGTNHASSLNNWAITGVRRNRSIVTPATNVTWNVNVQAIVGSDSANAEVELLIDGKLADKQRVTIEADTNAGCVFQYQFDAVGMHNVEFRVTGDNLVVDDHWYEVLNVRDKIPALCIEGTNDAARNVALALAPADSSFVDVRVIPDHRMHEIVLTDYEAVFLCNVGRFTAERVGQLQDYLRTNRSVVFFLGDQVSPQNYNRMLVEADSPIIPATLIDVAPYASYRLAPNDYRHPIVAPFRGQERAGLLTTPIWSYMRLRTDSTGTDNQTSNLEGTERPSTALSGSRVRVALSFTNGDPAIIEHSNLGGHCIVFAIPGSELSVSRQTGQLRPWTAWSAWPSFPPIIQETLNHSLASQEESLNVEVGEPISSRLPNSSGAQFVSIAIPKGSIQRVAVQEDVGAASWLYGPTQSAGFYQASTEDKQTSNQFAVNLASSREGYLEPVDPESLPSQFQQNAIQATNNQDVASVGKSRKSLFRWMLGLLLSLLFAESYFAWYLGNARS